jgi:hypothetical protein
MPLNLLSKISKSVLKKFLGIRLGGSVQMRCCQCSNPALFLVGPENARVPLCLDCNLKFVQMTTMQNDMLERLMNHLTEENIQH